MTAPTRKTSKPLTAVDIAKDVIRLLDRKQIKSSNDVPSCYVDSEQFIYHKPMAKPRSLQRAIKLKSYRPCQVCALGALFVSYVDQANGVMTNEPLNDLRTIYAKLRPYFSDKQLALIETAFETRVMRNRDELDPAKTGSFLSIPDSDTPYGGNYAVAQKAARFGMQFEKREDRIRAIMKNIIDNDGKFRPYDPTPVIYE